MRSMKYGGDYWCGKGRVLPVDFDLVVDAGGAWHVADRFLSHLFDEVAADGAAEDDVLSIGMRANRCASQMGMVAEHAVDADL